MSMEAVLKVVGAVAGIGWIALGVFLLLFREVIRRNIFPNLKQSQAYNIINRFMTLSFVIAIAGIIAWVVSLWAPQPDQGHKNGTPKNGVTSVGFVVKEPSNQQFIPRGSQIFLQGTGLAAKTALEIRVCRGAPKGSKGPVE